MKWLLCAAMCSIVIIAHMYMAKWGFFRKKGDKFIEL